MERKNKIEFADVIVDLQAGDTGKGKVAHELLKKGNYDYVVRYNGGNNAGHTIYHNGIKVVTHSIPCGVLYGIKSVIGLGCVVNPKALEEEIAYLENLGFKGVRDNLLIDKRAHIICDYHINEDVDNNKIGTTGKGIGPTYRDKYDRIGLRAEQGLPDSLYDNLFDVYNLEGRILFEGAQGLELDIDWGDYPYVTSSHCTVGSAILNGVPPQSIRKVYGTAKAYRTYVGNKDFQGDNAIFDKIAEVGNEYGSTTGRKRQVAYLDVDQLVKGCNINGVTDLIISKLDVLIEVDEFVFYRDGLLHRSTKDQFLKFINEYLFTNCFFLQDIKFSTNPHGI
jgi:adenylosuccinate synthase